MRQDLIDMLKRKALKTEKRKEYCEKIIWFSENDEITQKFLKDNNAYFTKQRRGLEGSLCIINNKEYLLLKPRQSNRGHKCCEAIIDNRISDERLLDIYSSFSVCSEVNFY